MWVQCSAVLSSFVSFLNLLAIILTNCIIYLILQLFEVIYRIPVSWVFWIQIYDRIQHRDRQYEFRYKLWGMFILFSQLTYLLVRLLMFIYFNFIVAPSGISVMWFLLWCVSLFSFASSFRKLYFYFDWYCLLLSFNNIFVIERKWFKKNENYRNWKLLYSII